MIPEMSNRTHWLGIGDWPSFLTVPNATTPVTNKPKRSSWFLLYYLLYYSAFIFSKLLSHSVWKPKKKIKKLPMV